MECSVMMLRHLREVEAADRLKSAIEKTYAAGKYLTGDVGGSSSTKDFTEAVIANL